MDFLQVTDIDGIVHLVAPSQIEHVSPANVIKDVVHSQLVLPSGQIIYVPSDVPTFIANLKVAIPTVTIGPI